MIRDQLLNMLLASRDSVCYISNFLEFQILKTLLFLDSVPLNIYNLFYCYSPRGRSKVTFRSLTPLRA